MSKIFNNTTERVVDDLKATLRRGREQNLYGTEFEVRLRNELTQKAVTRPEYRGEIDPTIFDPIQLAVLAQNGISLKMEETH